MPTYYLPCEMNLGDVSDAEKSRHNLDIGPLQFMNSDDVFFTGGRIAFDELVYKNKNASKNDLLMLSNNELIWSSNDVYNSWAFDEVVNVSAFSDLDYFVRESDIHSFVTTNDYRYLENIPIIDDAIPSSFDTDTKLFRKDSNLLDLAMQLRLGETVNRSVDFGRVNAMFEYTLGNLSYEPEILPKVRFVHFQNFRMYSEGMFPGMYMYSSTIVNDLTLMSRNHVVWKSPFLEDDNVTIRDGFVLLNDFITNGDNNESSVTMSSLNFYHTNLSERIEIMQDSLDIPRISRIMNERGEDGYFLVQASNINDVQSQEHSRVNLGIGTLSTNDTSDTTLSIIEIQNEFKMPFLIEDGSFDENVSFLIVDNNGQLTLSEFPSPTIQTTGAVYINNDADILLDLDTTNAFENVPTVALYSNMLTNIDALMSDTKSRLQIFFDDLFNPPDGVLNPELDGFESYTVQELENAGVYQNLGLSTVSYTADWNDLVIKPTSVDDYYNDIGAIRINSSFYGSDSLNQEEARSNLSLGNMSLQDDRRISITGGNITLDNATLYDVVIPPENLYIDISSNLLTYTTGNVARWRSLQTATDEIYGIVRLFDSYDVDSRDSVVTGNSVKNMFDILLSKVNAIQAKLDAITL